MSRDQFERDLKEYLKARKKATSFNIKDFIDEIIKKTKRTVRIPESIQVYGEKEKKEAQEAVKEGLFNKMFKKGPVSEELIHVKMKAEDAVDDLKEMAKISLNMIRKLPDEYLRTFKESDDFGKLKILLKKHELIK